jgi:hypothetical protein
MNISNSLTTLNYSVRNLPKKLDLYLRGIKLPKDAHTVESTTSELPPDWYIEKLFTTYSNPK